MSVDRTPVKVLRPFGNPIQFGFGIAPEVDAHLARAAHLISRRDASLGALRDAYEAAPDQLETLVALFKLLFYQGETDEAESLVKETLRKAAEQGRFINDWTQLDQQSAPWREPRGPGRHYLYSLKALAFIRLRQDDLASARELLVAIGRIDPDDLVGADVLRDLLSGLEQESGDG
jgi:tetratricopeptide (TPR) repeat protein